MKRNRIELTDNVLKDINKQPGSESIRPGIKNFDMIYTATDPVEGTNALFSIYSDAAEYATSGNIMLGSPIRIIKIT